MDFDVNKVGCLAEYKFMVKCMELGYIVSKPTLSASVYDVIVDNGDRLVKIQIKSRKSTMGYKNSMYKNPRVSFSNQSNYRITDFDYYAVYIYDLDLWIVFPNGALKTFVLTEKNIKKYSTFAFR